MYVFTRGGQGPSLVAPQPKEREERKTRKKAERKENGSGLLSSLLELLLATCVVRRDCLPT
jgi:hypothetical protein